MQGSFFIMDSSEEWLIFLCPKTRKGSKWNRNVKVEVQRGREARARLLASDLWAARQPVTGTYENQRTIYGHCDKPTEAVQT